MVMVAGHGEAWQAVSLSLLYQSGADGGAAPNGGSGTETFFLPLWFHCGVVWFR